MVHQPSRAPYGRGTIVRPFGRFSESGIWPLPCHWSPGTAFPPLMTIHPGTRPVLLHSPDPFGGRRHFLPDSLVLSASSLPAYCLGTFTILDPLIDLVVFLWPFRFETVGFPGRRIRWAGSSIASTLCPWRRIKAPMVTCWTMTDSKGPTGGHHGKFDHHSCST